MTQDILAAIAEDERLVNEIGSAVRSWYADGGGDVWRRGEPPAYAPFVAGQGEVGRHIARHDPERVLRQAQAHRRILELHRPANIRGCGDPDHDEYICVRCDSDDDTGGPPWPCDTVRALADAYGVDG